MTFRERAAIEEFIKNAEKTAETSPVQMIQAAIKHIKALTGYVDQLERGGG